MRTLFENGTLEEVRIENHIITMDSLKRFIVRKESNGHLVLESSSTQSYEWVRNFVENINKNQWAA